jgi:hypothetical protein
MQSFFHRYDATQRRRLLADALFVRRPDRVWNHPDGRAIGEGVACAIADEPFFRYIGLALPEIEVVTPGPVTSTGPTED